MIILLKPCAPDVFSNKSGRYISYSSILLPFAIGSDILNDFDVEYHKDIEDLEDNITSIDALIYNSKY